jgi:hypothetical protein
MTAVGRYFGAWTLVGAGAGLGLSVPAALAQTITVSSITSNSPNLGNVVPGASGTGNTTFRITPAGAVSVTGGGSGSRTSSAAIPLTTVVITCTGSNNCSSTKIKVTISANGSTAKRGKALTNFTIGTVTGTTVSSAPGTGSSITFTLNAIAKNATLSFPIGMDFPISDQGTSTSGTATSGFDVDASKSTSTPSNGLSGTATAVTFRPISMSQGAAHLEFGTIVKPASGSGTISVDASTGVRTVGVGTGLSSPTPTRGTYTVTGEGGQTFSISAPAFNMVSGAHSIAVTPVISSHTALSGAIGSQGTTTFGVGGSFPLASTTSSGAYSGQFVVTVQYN